MGLSLVAVALFAWADDPLAQPPTATPADGPWSLELMVLAEPEQPRDHDCGSRDCFTPARASFGGGVRAVYREPHAWSLAATVALSTLVDQEQRPPGYGALSARLDFQVELGRTADRFGCALRASEVLVLAWGEQSSSSDGDHGVDVLSDVPGVALVLGTTRLYGEAGLRVLPTPADPRVFHLAFGFDLGRWSGTAGIGTFGTLGFREGEVAAINTHFGLYGDVALRVTPRFDLRLMAVIGLPVQLALGFGWHFAAASD